MGDAEEAVRYLMAEQVSRLTGPAPGHDLDRAVSERSHFVDGVLAGLVRIGALDERRGQQLRKEWASQLFSVVFRRTSDLGQITGRGERARRVTPHGTLRTVIPVVKRLPFGPGEVTVSAFEIWTGACVLRSYLSLPQEVTHPLTEDQAPTFALRHRGSTSYLLSSRAVRGFGGFYAFDDVFTPSLDEEVREVTVEVIEGTGRVVAEIPVRTGGG